MLSARRRPFAPENGEARHADQFHVWGTRLARRDDRLGPRLHVDPPSSSLHAPPHGVHGTLRIRGGARQRWLCCGAALVQADAAHEVDARDAAVLIAFIEPESTLGAALSHRTRHRTRGGTRTGALAPRHRPGS